MVVHAFNSIKGGRGKQTSKFEASLVYRVCSTIAGTTQRNSVSTSKQTENSCGFYLGRLLTYTFSSSFLYYCLVGARP